MFFQKLKIPFNFCLDLLFPIECLGCQKVEGKWLCQECQERILYFQPEFLGCPRCGKIVKDKPNGSFCPHHRSPLNGLWIVYDYKGEVIRKLIHYFKYKHIEELAEKLGALVVDFLKKVEGGHWQNNFDAISFVPLHRRRLAERGYNQSKILAGEVAAFLKLPLVDILKRKRYTKPQVDLGFEQRFDNVKDAFCFNNNYEIKGKRILLIDDVYTTGSTLKECAKELKKARARKVWALVLAKG